MGNAARPDSARLVAWGSAIVLALADIATSIATASLWPLAAFAGLAIPLMPFRTRS
ncbi:hypothetical protein [Agromyces archimandritae]|uniref:Uncharacterized protein n=1 Tax=Agromyces archimandritae TaxID=2781962 RepID=A0A975IMJ2_9MICO|nr:hypothetical protein [Agromyces archimandritae]QTX03548.1 hypothetical protein G127AT_09290 [Agromyces archimandritae]